jgi:hypothetical protein
MHILKLQRPGGGSAGLVLPKDSLRQEGLVDAHGKLVSEEVNLEIYRAGPSEWRIRRLDSEYRPLTREQSA